MTHRELLVFDGDDTLWHVEHLYDEARAMARRVVEHARLDGAVWEQLERRLDVANVERLGLSRQRFPTSCLEAYVQLAASVGVHQDAEVGQRVLEAARTVFERRAPLVPGVAEVLDAVSREYRLALLTQGDELVQQKRIADSGIGPRFELISIVPRKSAEEMADVLTRLSVDPGRAWSVGNSLPSDINPALSLGMSAVWVHAHVWEHEKRETLPQHGHLHEIERLTELPGLLASLRPAI